MTRNELYDTLLAEGDKINISDYNRDTGMWVYEGLTETAQELLIQLGLDTLVEAYVVRQAEGKIDEV